MSKKIIIAPSIMCSSVFDMESYIRAFEDAGVDVIHFDVMDGHYVPNIMMGVRDYRAVKEMTDIPVDIHLMCTEPERFLEYFSPEPDDWVSFHPETARNPYKLLQEIRGRGCRGGIALSPGIPVSYVREMAGVLDFVLVMAVNPGFSGQKMVPDHLDKLRRIRAEIDGTGLPIDVMVDGNTSVENSVRMIAAGADGLVAGTASVMNGGPERFAELYRSFAAEINQRGG